jgi:hypothetical protein
MKYVHGSLVGYRRETHSTLTKIRRQSGALRSEYTARLYTSKFSDFVSTHWLYKYYGIHLQEYFVLYILSFSFHKVSFTPTFPFNEAVFSQGRMSRAIVVVVHEDEVRAWGRTEQYWLMLRVV